MKLLPHIAIFLSLISGCSSERVYECTLEYGVTKKPSFRLTIDKNEKSVEWYDISRSRPQVGRDVEIVGDNIFWTLRGKDYSFDADSRKVMLGGPGNAWNCD